MCCKQSPNQPYLTTRQYWPPLAELGLRSVVTLLAVHISQHLCT